MRPTLLSRLRSAFARIIHADSPKNSVISVDDMWKRLEATPYWARITADAEIERVRNGIEQLVKKYRGNTAGGYVLIDRAYGLDFLADLEAAGIAVMGCDHYHYVPLRGAAAPLVDRGKLVEVNGKNYVVYPGTRLNQAGFPEALTEILDGGFYVGDEILFSNEPTVPSIGTTRKHILNNLPPQVMFIEVALIIPHGWLGHTSPYS